jgi:Fe-S-cluster containining protein
MLRDAVIHASQRPNVRDAVARVYADLQVQIDARKPLCSASGRCCRFEEYGHRLYVTTMELAAFVYEMQLNGPLPIANLQRPIASSPGCPFQVDGLCGVHAIRPFGCRIFFCDATSDEWQHQQYERLHAELKRLHEALDVPYRYVEWRHALDELQLAQILPLAVSRTDAARPDQPPAEGAARKLSLPQLPL